MKICLCYAHTLEGAGSGAIGYINESKESRYLTDLVYNILKEMGHDVDIRGVDKSSNYLNELVKKVNSKKYDLVVQIHFNAHKKTNGKMGTETYYYSTSQHGKKIAKQVNDKLSSIYKNRGIKEGNHLYFIKNTKDTALLIECCFVDALEDTNTYSLNKKETAILIAEGLTNQKYKPTSLNKPTQNKLYRVIVGSYNKENAEKMKKELITKGYKDTFIMEV